MDKTKLEYRAEKLEAVLADPNYQETIGEWLREQQVIALRNFVGNSQIDDREMYRFQGAYKLLDTFNIWIESVRAHAKAARDKRNRVEEKKANTKESV